MNVTRHDDKERWKALATSKRWRCTLCSAELESISELADHIHALHPWDEGDAGSGVRIDPLETHSA
jgi:hypothetical protein